MSYEQLSKTYQQWEDRMAHHGHGDQPFCVAFCGVFSSGKSSLLNALLDCSYKLPVGINPVTKLVTRIRYGSKPTLKYLSGGSEVLIPQQDMDLVITGKKALPKGCTELIMELPAQILKSGNVEFIDTPGYEDEAALEDLSRAAVLTADLIIFCCNATMLGKQFEKEYLQELNLSHGNFCIVVNRADCLNTDEDLENVKHTAARLMSGRGNAAHPQEKQGRYFLTIAAGAYFNLNGFDTHIRNLLGNAQEKAAIRRSTNQCFTAYHKNRLRKAVQAERSDLTVQLRKLEIDDNARREREALQHKTRQGQMINKLSNLSVDGQVHIRKAKTDVLSQISFANDAKTFQSQIENCVHTKVSLLIQSLVAMVRSCGLSQDYRVRNALTNYLSCSIPEPTYRKVVTRGFLERAINTIFDLSYDDGTSWVFNDFKTPANNAVEAHFEKLTATWNKLILDFRSQQTTAAPAFTPNPRIRQLQSELTRLTELETKMDKREAGFTQEELLTDPDALCKHLESLATGFGRSLMIRPEGVPLRDKLNEKIAAWKNGSLSILVVGEFSVGKTTLMSALAGVNLCSPHAFMGYTTRVIPCQAEERVTLWNRSIWQSKELPAPENWPETVTKSHEVTFYTRCRGLGTSMISIRDSLFMTRTDSLADRLDQQQADAIVLVIDATKPFMAYTLEYLTQVAPSIRKKLFVVVSRIDCISDAELPVLKALVRKQLAPVFAAPGGGPDEDLLNSRVFYVNSYGALCAKTGRPLQVMGNSIPSDLEHTGLPELEAALKAHLYTTQRIKAAFQPVYMYIKQIRQMHPRLFGASFPGEAVEKLEALTACMEPRKAPTQSAPAANTSAAPQKAADSCRAPDRSAHADKGAALFQSAMNLHRERKYQYAYPYLKQAAEAGHPNAQFFLGRYYEDGVAVQKSREKALYWYNQAANQGHAVARGRLKLI